jgi:hypothetical protein
MRTANIFAIAALIGLGAAAFASSASAQSAARDAAIHKCVNGAQAQFPNVGEESTMRARTDWYRSCMQSAGQAP